MSIHDFMADDADIDPTILDDERLADELAGIVEITAAFLVADGPGLASSFTAFSCGIYSFEELCADLWRLGAWIRGNA